MNPLLNKKKYLRVVARAEEELARPFFTHQRAPMSVAFTRTSKYVRRILPHHVLPHGTRNEHADDIALQALSDAATKAGRTAEFQTDL